MSNDLGLDFERMFSNFKTEEKQEHEFKSLIKSFQDQLISQDAEFVTEDNEKVISRSTTYKNQYYILPDKKLVLYKNKVYSFDDFDTCAYLLDNDIKVEEISKIFDIPRKVILDVVNIKKNIK